MCCVQSGRSKPYDVIVIRDSAMADNVEWILDREERIVIGAANGHLQRWPYRVPPIINGLCAPLMPGVICPRRM